MDVVRGRHSQIIGALARHYPVAMPVTGGQDSRLLLAFAKPHLDKVRLFFTHVTNGNTLNDSNVAEELCRLIGVNHTRFSIKGSFQKYRPEMGLRDIRRRTMVRRGYLLDDADLILSPKIKREIAAAHAVPQDHIVLRGHVTDICKAVLWRSIGLTHFGSHRTSATPQKIAASLMQLLPKASREPVKADFFYPLYNKWIEGLPRNAHRRSIDFMGLEQYRPYTLGTGFQGHEDNFYIAPGNDRRIIEALIKMPPDMRAALHVNDLLLEQSAPELTDVKYVRVQDNDMRIERKPIEAYLDTE